MADVGCGCGEPPRSNSSLCWACKRLPPTALPATNTFLPCAPLLPRPNPTPTPHPQAGEALLTVAAAFPASSFSGYDIDKDALRWVALACLLTFYPAFLRITRNRHCRAQGSPTFAALPPPFSTASIHASGAGRPRLRRRAAASPTAPFSTRAWTRSACRGSPRTRCAAVPQYPSSEQHSAASAPALPPALLQPPFLLRRPLPPACSWS